MSLLIPPSCFMAHETNVTVATPPGTSVASHATTAHTKNGTYTELIASTAFDAYLVEIMLSDVNVSGSATSLLVDIAIGAAASETVIIPNLNAGYAGAASHAAAGGQKYRFPLYIPAGSRVSATAQSLIVADTVRCSVWLYGNPTRPVWAGTTVTDYGTTLASSQGTTVVCGINAAEGAWTQIVAATTKPHWYLAAGVGGAADTSIQDTSAFLDIGVGAATESAIASDLYFALNSLERVEYPGPLGAYAQIASGERLAARISNVFNSAQSLDVIYYGVS